MINTIYSDKTDYYYSQSRDDLISLIPSNINNVVLEIGAGSGATLEKILHCKKAKRVVGVELIENENIKKKKSENFEVVFGNIEHIDLKYPNAFFNVIICGDIIEHTTNPWQVVAKLKNHLTNDGLLIASIPNVREISVFYKLFILGDFSYTEEGIFDKTHLRFFCKKNILDLFKTNKDHSVTAYPILNFNNKSIRRWINLLTFRIFEEFLTPQYIVVSKKQ